MICLVTEGPYEGCRVLTFGSDGTPYLRVQTAEGSTKIPDTPSRYFPPNCYAPPAASLAEHLYAAYNRAGPPLFVGKSWDGCGAPTWAELQSAADTIPSARAVIEKWQAVAARVVPVDGATHG